MKLHIETLEYNDFEDIKLGKSFWIFDERDKHYKYGDFIIFCGLTEEGIEIERAIICRVNSVFRNTINSLLLQPDHAVVGFKKIYEIEDETDD